MNVTMTLLKMCSTIHQLEGWQDSKGSMIEYVYAKSYGYVFVK